MAEKTAEIDDEVETIDEDVAPVGSRSENLADKKRIRDQLLQVFETVTQGFEDQADRSNKISDFWDIYNCLLGPKQFYSGNSQIFVPLVRNAVDARVTRFVNQMFPQSGKTVEAVTEDGELPYALMSLLENYVDKTQLRTKVAPALVRNGDIEGHYHILCDWFKTERNVVRRVKKLHDDADPESKDDDDEYEDIEESVVISQRPDVEVLSDCDVLVLPTTVDTIEEALARGGSVTVLRRWTKGQIRRMMKSGEIDRAVGRSLIEELNSDSTLQDNLKSQKQKNVDAAGVKVDRASKYVLVYMTWTMIRISKDEERLCLAYYGGEEKILSCRRNPVWSDRCPLLSIPVKKVAGAFKGMSMVEPCADMQYAANDAVNEGMDSAAYALMPIIMTDPEKNPRVGSMVLSMAAVWETSPNDTQFAKFPDLWREAFAIVNSAKAEIHEALGINPAMLTRQGSMKRLNQAEVANEQQVDILSTADAVTNIEGGILSPMLQLWIELDHQYRTDEIYIKQIGEPGVRAKIEAIAPVQWEMRVRFKWLGVEAARNAQQIQQQIAAMNVIRGIPPDQYPGYRINLIPIITQVVENAFGPRLAPLIFEDMSKEITIDPQIENEMMAEGVPVMVHPADDDPKHLKAHMKELENGDPAGLVREHIIEHQRSMSLKMQNAAMQAMQATQAAQAGVAPGAQGVPGGVGPGVPGTPRMGAQPGAPRLQGPPGMIHQDQMQDPQVMPRM